MIFLWGQWEQHVAERPLGYSPLTLSLQLTISSHNLPDCVSPISPHLTPPVRLPRSCSRRPGLLVVRLVSFCLSGFPISVTPPRLSGPSIHVPPGRVHISPEPASGGPLCRVGRHGREGPRYQGARERGQGPDSVPCKLPSQVAHLPCLLSLHWTHALWSRLGWREGSSL